MITKPSYLESDIWANDQVEGINIINPDNAYKSTGWIYGQKPPYTVMNWIQNTNSEMLVHINQNGIAQWDILTNYNQNAYVNYNDKIYIANAATVGVAPDASADWGEDLALTPDNLIITAEDPRTDGAAKIVQTGANGLIDISLMPIGGMTYIGNYDMTATAPSPVDSGDFVTALADGVIDASWTGVGGTNAHASQSFIWDGAAWNAMAADTDLMGQYLRRDGLDIGMTGPFKVGQADTDNHAVTLYGDTTIGSAANPRIFTVNGNTINTSELEKISDIDTGWRLRGATAGNHGPIGDWALDFSEQTQASATHGATGGTSFAIGARTTASAGYSFVGGRLSQATEYASFSFGEECHSSGWYSTSFGRSAAASGESSLALGDDVVASEWGAAAFGLTTKAINQGSFTSGTFNVGTSLQTISEVGIGTAIASELNGFEVYKTGRVRAPEQTIALIDTETDGLDSGLSDRTLTTKEYVIGKTTEITSGTVDITYDNAASGLTAVTLKTAIDEVAAEVAGNGWPTEFDDIGDGVQDTFQPTGGYVVGKVTVFSDGVKLRNDVSEYTATDGINVVLTQVPDLDTWINIVYLQA